VRNGALPEFVERAEPVGGYMNFFIKPAAYAQAVLEAVREEGENYGGSSEGANRNICIDYSSINIAKPFHIGHLSSTVIAIRFTVFPAHGLQLHRHQPPGRLGHAVRQAHRGLQALGRARGGGEGLHPRAAGSLRPLPRRGRKDERLNDEARAWFKRIEDGDDEALSLFEWFKSLTLREVGRVYDMLGIAFDSYAGESFYNDKMGRVIEELEDRNLLKLDDGAYLVDLNEYNMPPCIVLRSDGATLYATRDIAAALYRKDTYDFAKCLYVVAYQQDLHFRQWFKVVELMGYDWAKDLVHVSFGMVSMQDGTLSTRKGKVVFLEEVLSAAVEKTLASSPKRAPIFRQARRRPPGGVGAVVWNALYSSRIKDIVFSWDKALNFDGENGPLRAVHPRALLRRAAQGRISDMPVGVDYSKLGDEDSMRVVRALSDFRRAVREAMEKYEP
jgi:arginyl-tRNA synthetase